MVGSEASWLLYSRGNYCPRARRAATWLLEAEIALRPPRSADRKVSEDEARRVAAAPPGSRAACEVASESSEDRVRSFERSGIAAIVLEAELA